MDNHYRALGGLEKVKSVMSRRMVGSMTMEPAGEASFKLLSKRPLKARMEITTQGQTGIQAFDGENGWMFMPFMGQVAPEIMPPEMTNSMREEADFDGPLVDYREKGHSLKLIGLGDVEGIPTYELELTHRNGELTTYHLSAESFLPMLTESDRNVQGTRLHVQTILSDYRDVDGMMIPHSIKVIQDMGSQTLTIEQIELNVEIDDAQFTMPTENQ
jgi:outer membrane lipoprotein-sorting protein